MDGRRRAATDSDDTTDPPSSDTESDGSGSNESNEVDSNVANTDTISLESSSTNTSVSTSASQQTNGYLQMLRDNCDYKFIIGSLAVAVVLTGGFYMVRQIRLNRK